ncbi:hypothetical protein CONCODRAFT_2938 [Conidiobolus coronatus NRRL 28638]|uniref:Uncharacterized protein n=1 Tax=Conidiobolus coronatus (strain ATCC 28846 / CBS 209.66 / NRRL 28638) TaxID=796925 RepID=A0A137PGB5_CONC2|nr:hypothetical protein CONCODRAFT_2938 [Conidiobolus coronatus NRRL 28638]|eukprot:KXN74046.1 hypothetical protein CONCODRAFT_2938 [Conidiobolus coronatus NRRL 28638]
MRGVKAYTNSIVRIALQDLVEELEGLNINKGHKEELVNSVQNYRINLGATIQPKKKWNRQPVPPEKQCQRLNKKGEKCGHNKATKDSCWIHLTDAEKAEHKKTLVANKEAKAVARKEREASEAAKKAEAKSTKAGSSAKKSTPNGTSSSAKQTKGTK